MSGLLVAFEGGDGVGKSTQLSLAAGWLREQGRSVLTTREPGGTDLGVELRRVLLDPGVDVGPRAETLLYAADRAHHVDTVITPALARGEVVLTDRYVDSTLAYQGAGRGLGDDARTITEWATGGLAPDLTILLDLEPAVALARAADRSGADRLESAPLPFHRAVRDGFLALAAENPARYAVLDACRDPHALAADVRSLIDLYLPSP